MNELKNTNDENSQKRKLLIFAGVAVFAIHTLVYIINFRLNFPHGDDILVLPFAYEYAKTEQFPYLEFISAASSHLTYHVHHPMSHVMHIIPCHMSGLVKMAAEKGIIV